MVETHMYAPLTSLVDTVDVLSRAVAKDGPGSDGKRQPGGPVEQEHAWTGYRY